MPHLMEEQIVPRLRRAARLGILRSLQSFHSARLEDTDPAHRPCLVSEHRKRTFVSNDLSLPKKPRRNPSRSSRSEGPPLLVPDEKREIAISARSPGE